MSRKRWRPSTRAEDAEVRAFAELAGVALAATGPERRDAYEQMRRAADSVRGSTSLAAMTARELLDKVAERWPTEAPEP